MRVPDFIGASPVYYEPDAEIALRNESEAYKYNGTITIVDASDRSSIFYWIKNMAGPGGAKAVVCDRSKLSPLTSHCP